MVHYKTLVCDFKFDDLIHICAKEIKYFPTIFMLPQVAITQFGENDMQN